MGFSPPGSSVLHCLLGLGGPIESVIIASSNYLILCLPLSSSFLQSMWWEMEFLGEFIPDKRLAHLLTLQRGDLDGIWWPSLEPASCGWTLGHLGTWLQGAPRLHLWLCGMLLTAFRQSIRNCFASGMGWLGRLPNSALAWVSPHCYGGGYRKRGISEKKSVWMGLRETLGSHPACVHSTISIFNLNNRTGEDSLLPPNINPFRNDL